MCCNLQGSGFWKEKQNPIYFPLALSRQVMNGDNKRGFVSVTKRIKTGNMPNSINGDNREERENEGAENEKGR